MTARKKLAIHSENILPIIKKWLYSDRDIFLRELVSNATDAISKVKALGGEGETKIDIRIEGKTLIIEDTGVGMTAEEVEKYIAQIAFSGAEEFVAKYKTEEPIIGHFGLGFYSAYMVASHVEIDTLSYLGGEAVSWSSDGGTEYEMGQGTRSNRGTKITLHINDEEYLNEGKIRELLDRHCLFMPYPITLNGKTVGNASPKWSEAGLEFYQKMFPRDFKEPIFWIHLNVDYPFHLEGVLYFPKINKRFDPNESTIKLFCNRVFVSDNCKDILPDYLTMMKGAIDSPDIPLNVSRSYLQTDANVKKLGSYISKKVADKLNEFYKNDREKFIAAWPDIEMIVKLGILQDEKFYDRVKDILIWKNKKGEWAPLSTEAPEITYATSEDSPLLALYNDVIFATNPLDTALLQFLEGKLKIKMHRIDSKVDAPLDDSMHFTLDGVTIEAKKMEKEEIPALIVVDEEQRRFRDYVRLTQGSSSMPLKHTLILNTNNKLVQAISKLQAKEPETAKSILQSLYDLSLLQQREIEPQEMGNLVSRQTQVLEKIATLLV